MNYAKTKFVFEINKNIDVFKMNKINSLENRNLVKRALNRVNNFLSKTTGNKKENKIIIQGEKISKGNFGCPEPILLPKIPVKKGILK